MKSRNKIERKQRLSRDSVCTESVGLKDTAFNHCQIYEMSILLGGQKVRMPSKLTMPFIF